MTGSKLELVKVTKRYGSATAVDAIDLRVPAGAYCCLLGPSGCGKTSTLRMIAGHESVTEGDIILGAQNVTELPPAGRGTAMMFQSYALFPHLSCVDNVAFSLKMKGVEKSKRRARAMELLELVAMEPYAERLPAQLSGGQQQRVALARALITEPQILLLDETVFTIGPNSTIIIDKFVYDPKSQKGEIKASITQGVFRYVSGKIAAKNPDSVKVKLPTASIGFRGTIVGGSVGIAAGGNKAHGAAVAKCERTRNRTKTC